MYSVEQWYNDKANGYDFASNDDLADLARVHPLWAFEAELESWDITDIKPFRDRPDIYLPDRQCALRFL